MARSLFISAGDLSGDQHAARLIKLFQERNPLINVWGIGGPTLEKLGVELLYNSQELAVVGIMNTLQMFPLLGEACDAMVKAIDERKPDAVLLVDYGGFNLMLAKALRKKHPALPIVYFISPQVWGSRPWRIKTIARTVTKMMVIFPFEETLYRGHNIDAHFVGHPLTDRYADMNEGLSKVEFCSQYHLDAEKPIIGIFPGSRKQEIKAFMPVLLQAISWLQVDHPGIQFAISQANQQIADKIYDAMDKAGKTKHAGTLIKFINSEDNRSLMAASDILWTKSGTTTLEAAFMEKPMLCFYKADWLSFVLFLLFKRVKYVCWPNLLAGKMLVPELIQLDCRAEQLVRYTRDLLDVPGARLNITEQLKNIKSYLSKGDVAANAAVHLQSVLDNQAVELKVAE